MVVYSIKTSKGTDSIRGPMSYVELTTKHYELIVKEWDGLDVVMLFCLLFNCKQYYTMLLESTDKSIELMILKGVKFFYEADVDLYNMPTPKFFDNSLVPSDLGDLSFGQSVMLRQYAEGRTIQECISFACAVYMQPILDNSKPDAKKINELKLKYDEYSVLKTYPLGTFFLRKLKNFGRTSRLQWFLINLKTKMQNLLSWPTQRKSWISLRT